MSDSEEFLCQPANLWTLPANQINQLDPYRDDPVLPPESYAARNTEEVSNSNKSTSVEKSEDSCQSTSFCMCNKCQWMPTESERICCQAKKFLIKMPNSKCVTLHEDFDQIINKSVLTINLKTVWNTGCVETDNMEISNDNLRYSGIVQN